MESKNGFLKMSIAEFIPWIHAQRIARTIITIQQHHTWSPTTPISTVEIISTDNQP
jgi:hypothetical protein